MALSFWRARDIQVKGEKCIAVENAGLFSSGALTWGAENKAQKNIQGMTQLPLRMLWADQVLQQCSGTEKTFFFLRSEGCFSYLEELG